MNAEAPLKEQIEILTIVLPIKSEGIEIKFPIYPLNEKDYDEWLKYYQAVDNLRKYAPSKAEEKLLAEFDELKAVGEHNFDFKQRERFEELGNLVFPLMAKVFKGVDENNNWVIRQLMQDCLAHFKNKDNLEGAYLIQQFRDKHYDAFNLEQSAKAFASICKLTIDEAQQIKDYYLAYILEKGAKKSDLEQKHKQENKALERERLSPEERIIKISELKVKQADELAALQDELQFKYFGETSK